MVRRNFLQRVKRLEAMGHSPIEDREGRGDKSVGCGSLVEYIGERVK